MDEHSISLKDEYNNFRNEITTKIKNTPPNYIESEDKVFIHSGYLLYDPHPELHFICNVVEAFIDRHVTILPQTVNLVGERMRKYVAKCFNQHPNLTLICRDDVSLAKAQQLFHKCELKLMPDVVTSLIGNNDFYYDNKREGILFCIRNDGEKFYSDNQISFLRSKFKCIKTSICDTTIKAPVWKWEKHREELIRSILQRFSKYQIIITDRYHGTIFSQIENTPVIVLSSTDHKLSSGVKWFPQKVFGSNIVFVENLDEAYCIAIKILKSNSKIVENPPYFRDKYYNNPL